MMQIAVIGSGVVGSATGKAFLSKGYSVTFIDKDSNQLQQLAEKIESQNASFQAVEEMNLREIDVIFLSVPTPTLESQFVPDHLLKATEALGRHLRDLKRRGSHRFRVVAIRSTIPPGTTHSQVIPTLEATSGLAVGSSFGICVCPEYLREQEAFKDSTNPRILVIGSDDQRSGYQLEMLYEPFDCPVVKIGIIEAEFQKYVHNLINATMISYFNEMRHVAERLGVDPTLAFYLVSQSAEARWNPIYGSRNLGAFKGSCLPKDTEAFFGYARNLGIEMPLLEAVIQINQSWLKRESTR